MIKTTKEIIRENESYLDFPIIDDKLIICNTLPNKVWVGRDELLELIDRGLNSSMKNNKGFVFALERLKVHLGVDEE